MDSTIPLLPNSKILSLLPSSVTVQSGLCRTWKTRRPVFSRRGSYNIPVMTPADPGLEVLLVTETCGKKISLILGFGSMGKEGMPGLSA